MARGALLAPGLFVPGESTALWSRRARRRRRTIPTPYNVPFSEVSPLSAAAVLQLPFDLPEDDSDDDPDERLRAAVHTVFETWQKATGKATARLLDTRASLIAMRLRQGYSVDDLCAAVRGWQYDPWCAGDNPHGTPYNALEYLLRISMNTNNVERFAELYRVTRALSADLA